MEAAAPAGFALLYPVRFPSTAAFSHARAELLQRYAEERVPLISAGYCCAFLWNGYTARKDELKLINCYGVRRR